MLSICGTKSQIPHDLKQQTRALLFLISLWSPERWAWLKTTVTSLWYRQQLSQTPSVADSRCLLLPSVLQFRMTHFQLNADQAWFPSHLHRSEPEAELLQSERCAMTPPPPRTQSDSYLNKPSRGSSQITVTKCGALRSLKRQEQVREAIHKTVQEPHYSYICFLVNCSAIKE